MGITAPERVPTRIDLRPCRIVGHRQLGIATRFAGVMDPAAFRLAFRWVVSGRMAGSDPICPALVVELGQAHRSEKNAHSREEQGAVSAAWSSGWVYWCGPSSSTAADSPSPNRHLVRLSGATHRKGMS